MSEPTTRTVRYLNRELSWIEFNQRVLEEAQDPDVPLFERIKFLAITASNLDEFFMVRVGGLRMLIEAGKTGRDIAGMTARQQLRQVSRRLRRFVRGQYACLNEMLTPALEEADIRRVRPADLTPEQEQFLGRVFEGEVLPLLTPLGVEDDADPPMIPGLTLILAVRLRPLRPDTPPGERLALVPVPKPVPRFFDVPVPKGHGYLSAEDLVGMHLHRLFPGEEPVEVRAFRITRDADMSVREDLAADLLARMEEVLIARRTGSCLRMEIDRDASEDLAGKLALILQVPEEGIFRVAGLPGLSDFLGFASSLPGHDRLRAEPWPPQPVPAAPQHESMFETLRRRDVLVFTPYESFDPVQRLVEEAAEDPDVLAIKQILYRTSRNSPFISALARAARLGKQVTALVELKARFDEARNIEWAQALERAGVQVIYGIRRLKTHAKICLVVRREPDGIRRYMHFGTGNYNEQTARLYSDVSYLTTQEEYGLDASAFFNAITGYSQPLPYRRIEAAPLGLRARLLELIRGETQRAAEGQQARIRAKVNSLADKTLIDALYEASRAGVQIDLSVRGICCLRPGVPGLSENIRVVSVVDRFLEHARIFYFHRGGRPQVFISSADWMPRNLDRRIELLVPVGDPAARRRLSGILRTCLDDTVKGRVLLPDGSYRRAQPRRKKLALRSQARFYAQARHAAEAAADTAKGVFEPHVPPEA